MLNRNTPHDSEHNPVKQLMIGGMAITSVLGLLFLGNYLKIPLAVKILEALRQGQISDEYMMEEACREATMLHHLGLDFENPQRRYAACSIRRTISNSPDVK